MQQAAAEEKKGEAEMKLSHYTTAKQCFINAAEVLMGVAKSKTRPPDPALKAKIKNLIQKVLWRLEE